MNKLEYLLKKHGDFNYFFKIEDIEFGLSFIREKELESKKINIIGAGIDIEEKNYNDTYGFFEEYFIILDNQNNYKQGNKSPLSNFLYNNLIDKIDNYLFLEYNLKQKLEYKLMKKTYTKEKVKKI